MTLAQFELVETESGPSPVIELLGEVDSTNAANFERGVQALTASGPVILDLSSVAYFDSAGFEVMDRLLGTGSLIVVISPASPLRRAAELMGVPFHDGVEPARAALAVR